MKTAKIISIVAQKGGAGKTTTTYVLATGLMQRGKKVLVIDLDSQRNLTKTFTTNLPENTAFELLQGEKKAQDCVIRTEIGLDLISSHRNLAVIEAILKDTGREYRLKEEIAEIKQEYDYILIDTPPALSLVTVNALVASDSVIIPCVPDAYNLQGLEGISITIDMVRKYCNPDLKIDGILITKFKGRTRVGRDLTESIEKIADKFLKTKVFNTKIRESIVVQEAQALQKDVLTFAPNCNACLDYQNWIKELGYKK